MRDLGCLLAMAAKVVRRYAGVDSVQFAGFDQGCHARPGAPTLIMPGEERVLAIQGDRPDGIFDGVGVHLDAAIGQEDLQAVPVAVDIAELFAK